MVFPLAPHKIRSEHLERLALVYVRQSTLAQVIENIGSKARQYDLVHRALDLGWSREQIEVIDQDQGLSAASAAGRDGFQFVIAQVGLGRVGAVLSLEASRLARSRSDWYRLIEICALTHTLVVDEEGVIRSHSIQRPLAPGHQGHHERSRTALAAQSSPGRQARKGPPGQAPPRCPHRTDLRCHRTGDPRPRRTGATGREARPRSVRRIGLS
jgi:hypothetical protein